MHANFSDPGHQVSWCLYELSGPDAADFLQRLASAHVRGLHPGHGTECAFLTAQGKFRAFFWLWRLAPDRFLLEFDATPSGIFESQLLAFIEEMTFGENLQIQKLSHLHWHWEFEPDASHAPPRGIESASDVGYRFHHGSKTFGRPWTSVWHRDPAPRLDLTWGDLTLWRTEALQPWPGQEITPETMPPEVGLPEIAARGKGCYPGQEVMEKIFSYGSSPRRLCRVVAPAGPPMLKILRKQDAKEGHPLVLEGQKVTVEACAPSTHDS